MKSFQSYAENLKEDYREKEKPEYFGVPKIADGIRPKLKKLWINFHNNLV